MNSETLILLLRNALDGGSRPLPPDTDWQALIRQAQVHGIEPMVYDAALRLPAEQLPDQPTVTMMKQVCLYGMQQQVLWKDRIRQAAQALHQAGISPVLLKGFGLAEYYPKPYLRSWGDADIWVGIRHYHPACAVLREVFTDAIHHDEEYDELKHYCYVFPDGKAVELHRVAMDFPTPEEDRLWQDIEVPAMDQAIAAFASPAPDGPSDGVQGLGLPVPSEPFNLLFVFLHAWEHFCGTGMPLKQLVDLSLLVKHDYLPLSEEQKRTYDAYLSKHLKAFCVTEGWMLTAYAMHEVLEISMPLYTPGKPNKWQKRFLQTMLTEGQNRQQNFDLGGKDRYDERERAKQMPVLARKMLTLKQRIRYALFLKQYAPRYAWHVFIARLRKGLRRTLRRERMIDY